MNFKEEDNNEKPVHLSEEQIARSIEHATKKTADVCLKHFEKFHKEEMEFQRKVQKEEAEYQRKIQLEDREYERTKRAEDNERNRRHLKSDMWWKVFATILAAAGLYLFFFGSIATDKANSQRAYNQHKIDLIREDIAEKKRIVQTGTEAISNLRLVDADIIQHCKYGHPYSQEKQEAMRRVALQKIYDAFAIVGYVFDNSVLEQGKALSLLEQNTPDVCAYKGDYDELLHQYKMKIYDIAHESIDKDKEKIEKMK